MVLTAGSGFINVGRERGADGYDLKLQNGHENGGHIEEVMMFKTNPATNDWIPSIEDHRRSMCPLRSQIGVRLVRSELNET
ncbi:unnamed protein product [Camellia sinensis]